MCALSRAVAARTYHTERRPLAITYGTIRSARWSNTGIVHLGDGQKSRHAVLIAIVGRIARASHRPRAQPLSQAKMALSGGSVVGKNRASKEVHASFSCAWAVGLGSHRLVCFFFFCGRDIRKGCPSQVLPLLVSQQSHRVIFSPLFSPFRGVSVRPMYVHFFLHTSALGGGSASTQWNRRLTCFGVLSCASHRGPCKLQAQLHKRDPSQN